MRFLFDIDDTLAITTPPWDEFSKVYFEKKGYQPIPGAHDRDIENNYEMTRLQKSLYYRFMDTHFDFARLQPKEGAVETVAELVKRGHKVDFVTARTDIHWLTTKTWLARYFFSVTVGDNYHVFYRRGLPELSAFDVLVDDNINRISLAMSAGKKAFLVDPDGYYDGYTVDDKPVVAIKSLPELLTLIEEKK